MVGFYGGDPLESKALTEMGSDAVQSTGSQVLGAALGEGAALGGYVLRAGRALMRQGAWYGTMGFDEAGNQIMGEPEPRIDTDAVNAEFGIPGHLKFDVPTPRSVAQDLYEHHRAKILRQDVTDRREGGFLTGGFMRFGAEMLGGAYDPIGLAVGFIPVLGEARIAGLLAQAGGALGRAGTRAAIGGAQGALGMAALQPLEFALSRSEHEDYTMAHALRAIALGTALGGGLHAGIGAGLDRLSGKYRNPIAQLVEESGPEVRQGFMRGALGQMIDGRPVNLEPGFDLADALRVREVQRMTVRERGGRVTDQALPGGFEDPLVLMRRGELTADRAAQIRDDLAALSPVEQAQAKARIGPHVDSEMWTVIEANLRKAEASREGAVEVIADQLKYLSVGGRLGTASEREAAAVISRAMQAEAGRGGDVASLIDAAYRQRQRTGATSRRATGAQKQQLLDMHARGMEGLAAGAPVEGGIAGDVSRRLVAMGEQPGGGRAPGRVRIPTAGREERPFERARTAGEPGGPRPTDTVAEINARADELERLQRSPSAESQAAVEAAAEAEGRASAIERAAVCITRG